MAEEAPDPSTITFKEEKAIDGFEQFIKSLNPNFAFYVNESGCPITSSSELGTAEAFCIICENPRNDTSLNGCVNRDKKMKKGDFDYLGRAVRESVTGNKDLCSGQLNKGFFSDLETETDVLFILYNITESENRKRFVFAGFSCCNDLSIIDDDGYEKHDVKDCDKEIQSGEEVEGVKKGGKTLYIDSICGKVKELGPELDFRQAQGKRPIRIGNILLKLIEDYAKMREFVQLKLSALLYVINYYRKIDYRHDKGCNDVEKPAIARLGGKLSRCIFKSDNAAQFTYELEKAIIMEPCTEGTDDEKYDKIAVYMIGEMGEHDFYNEEVGTTEEKNNPQNLDIILDYLQRNTIYKNEEEQKVPFPINKNNIVRKCQEANEDSQQAKDGPIGIYRLIKELGHEGYTVSIKNQKMTSRQQEIQRDDEGYKLDIHGEGYTMRKCIRDQRYKCINADEEPTIDKVCIKPSEEQQQASQGGKKKRKTKKNKKAKKHKKTHKKRKRKSKSKKKKSKRKTKKNKK